MLDSLIAQKLAGKIIKQLGWNINIMNEKGIIIASGDQKRIGDFHEIAYKLIKDKLDVIIVREGDMEYIGVKPGVNMPILHNNQTIGVIGITGNPDEILNFAYVVKMSVETMVEYELYKEQIRKRQNNKNVFMNALLYEEYTNMDKIATLARDLQYDEKHIRLPVYIKMLSGMEAAHALELIKNSSAHEKQDISMITDSDHILIYKTIPQDMIKNYKITVTQYVQNIDAVFQWYSKTEKCIYYAGNIQNRFEHYRQAYHHVCWLEKHTQGQNAALYFLSDHILQYIQETVPFEAYERLFSVYRTRIDELGGKVFAETITALYENDMNINRAAEKLYVHRNTVIFRLNKVRDQLGLDPIKSTKDLQFLLHLLYYYNNTQKQ